MTRSTATGTTLRVLPGGEQSASPAQSSPSVKAEPTTGQAPPPAPRSPVETISIMRGEGPTSECSGQPIVVKTWTDARMVTRGFAVTAPDTGGYDKTDVIVRWANGQTYSLRADLQRQHAVDGYDVAEHIRSMIEHHINPRDDRARSYVETLERQRPGTIAGYAKLLETLDLQQPIPPAPCYACGATVSVERVGELPQYAAHTDNATGETCQGYNVPTTPEIFEKWRTDHAIRAAVNREHAAEEAAKLAARQASPGGAPVTDAQRKDPRLALRSPEELRAIASDIDSTCKTIREALAARSGKVWTVTRGRGTGYCWLRIKAPPRRCGDFNYMTAADAAELGLLLGSDRPVSQQGEQIPASTDHRVQYLELALGLPVTKVAARYWD